MREVLSVSARDERTPGRAEIDRLWRDLLNGRWRLIGLLARDRTYYIVCIEEREIRRSGLSGMQLRVVLMAAHGRTNKEIAFDLQMSEATVATHVRRALRKLEPLSRPYLWILHALLFGTGEQEPSSLAGRSRARSGASKADAQTTDWQQPLRIAEIIDPRGRVTVISLSCSRRNAVLTPTEWEVAWLATCGMSNSVIAQLRMRSPRTIANQLASAFRKLGLSARSELTMALVAATQGEDEM